jgi:hypothetical protein
MVWEMHAGRNTSGAFFFFFFETSVTSRLHVVTCRRTVTRINAFRSPVPSRAAKHPVRAPGSPSGVPDTLHAAQVR